VSGAGGRLAEYLQRLRGTALEVLGMLGEEARAGRRPAALAAAAVYSAETVLSMCQGRRRWITQRELAECGETAEYTIREQCAGLFLQIVKVVVDRRKRDGVDRARWAAGSDLFTTAATSAT
jgi:transcription initiation factor TFIIIB Brf1 subunit/transcription initiation factor TFIIB